MLNCWRRVYDNVETSPMTQKWLRLLSVIRRRFAVVESLLIVAPLLWFCVCSMFNCTLFCVPFSFAIILMGKRNLVALLCVL